MSDAPTAISEATTPETRPSSDGLYALSDDQRSHWLKTGDLPSETPTESDLVDPSGEPSGEPANESADPVVATAPAQTTPKTPNPRTDMKARLGQLSEKTRLATERAEKAERELATLRSAPAPQIATPAQQTAPATTTPDTPGYLDLVKRYQGDPAWPTLEAASRAGFDDPYGATMAAQAAFIQHRQGVEREQAAAHYAQRSREQDRINHGFTEARKIPGFKESALDFTVTPALAQTIFESDLSGQVLNYFSENPTEGRAIAAMEPLAAARAIGKIEAGLAPSSSVVPSTPAASKTVSSAPPPTLTLGSRHTSGPTDEVEEAVRAGDTGRFIEAANRRDFAALKEGRR